MVETFFVFDDQFYQDFAELLAPLKMSSFLFSLSMNFYYFFFGTLHRCLEFCPPCFLGHVSLLAFLSLFASLFLCRFLSVSDWLQSLLFICLGLFDLAAAFVELCLTAAVSPWQRGYSPKKTQQSGGDRRQICLDCYWLRAGLPKRRCDWQTQRSHIP